MKNLRHSNQKPKNYSKENYLSYVENGVVQKRWITAGSDPCDVCRANAKQGPVAIEDKFISGHLYDPAHDGCECYIEACEIDLDSIQV